MAGRLCCALGWQGRRVASPTAVTAAGNDVASGRRGAISQAAEKKRWIWVPRTLLLPSAVCFFLEREIYAGEYQFSKSRVIRLS